MINKKSKQVQNVADLGFPIDLEKALTLQPDLIITGNTDEKQYAALSKIAPTIVFDTFAPLNERLLHLGEIVNKKKAAEDWLAQYKIKEIEPSQLPDYAGNRIFMLIPTASDSKRTLERMLNSSLWRSLPAVRQGQVYFVEADRWNWNDAMTRQKLLTALPKLLGVSS
ncbi:ferrichrome-binding protein [Paenibacillus terrae HPL-003]|uniref:Ferrichrome-binding protein n=1 Tax=Paenibacillus terrae (strain HPL-003) TaxID=985665 RepID=G7W257_PAETH|nr:ABC transporter substrate-binding protein [Paenibacillus terrae]AET59641.1 ferrichrome-binding protein [Paenibacillus terrae HPL-003]